MLRVWSAFPYTDRTGEKRGLFLPMKLLAQHRLAQTAIVTNETEENEHLESFWNGLVPVIKTKRGKNGWSAKARLSLMLLQPHLPADVVFVFPWTHWTKTVILARYLFGRPYVLCLDTYHYARQKSLRRHLYQQIRYGWLLRNANLVIGETPEVAEAARQRLPHVRVIYLPMGLDMEPLDAMREKWQRSGVIPQHTKTVLFVGRISPEKRPHLLVELFSELAQEFPEWKLRLIGPLLGQDGKAVTEYEYKFRQTMAESTARERIEWIPGLYGEDLYREYANASLYTLLSDREGVPTTVIEAMYFGDAVLATFVGVVDWQLDYGRAGIYADVNDREALKNGLRQLMENADLRAKLGEAAHRRVVEEFNWENHIDTLYEELLRLFPKRRLNELENKVN